MRQPIRLMLFVMTCSVLFPAFAGRSEFSINQVEKIETQSSWKTLTDTAVVKIPARWTYQEKDVAIRDLIRAGDPVKISLGYDGDLKQVFSGYVRSLSPGAPIMIECEDEMYTLKKTPVNVSYEQVSLPTLLSDLIPDKITVDSDNVDLGAIRASNTTLAKLLDKIKDQYGFVSYFRNGVLRVGKVYIDSQDQGASFFLEKNILSDQLQYEDESRPLRVKAISNQKDGSKIEVEIGDPGGEIRTLNYFNLSSESELKRLAEADMAKLKVSGYQGSFTAYGIPVVSHGEIVSLSSTEYPERDGKYYAESVDVSFSASGYRQKIKLGTRAL